MSKMSELSQVLDEMISCGEGMIRAAKEVKEIFSESAEDTASAYEKETEAAIEPEVPEKESGKPAEKVLPAYSFEEVRKAFAAKARAGHTAEVRQLILKYGADRLSGISQDKYPALMAELEGIGNE